MKDRINLKDERFERLLVVSEDTERRVGARRFWFCNCDCGTKNYSVRQDHLIHKETKSCGCLADEIRIRSGKSHRIEDRDSVLCKGLFAKFKNEIRKRKVKTPVEINLEQFVILSKSNCFYCNAIPQNEFTYLYSGEKLKYSGIDRKDNSVGYIFENIVPCCWRCNSAKNNMELKIFAFWLKSIYENFGKSDEYLNLINAKD